MNRQLHNLTVIAACCLLALPQPVRAEGPAKAGASTAELHQKVKMSRAERMQRYRERTGGLVKLRAGGPAIAIVNAQNRVGKDVFSAPIDKIETMLLLPVDLRTAEVKDPVKEAKGLLNFQTGAVILVCDDPDLPMMLVAPEAKWAIMNVAVLAKDNPKAETLTKRAQQELWRTFGYLMGAANSITPGCLLTKVNGNEDLDKLLADSICPESYGKIIGVADKYGIQRLRTGNYKKALEEGWAPPPADEYQKKIYEDFKAGKK